MHDPDKHCRLLEHVELHPEYLIQEEPYETGAEQGSVRKHNYKNFSKQYL